MRANVGLVPRQRHDGRDGSTVRADGPHARRLIVGHGHQLTRNERGEGDAVHLVHAVRALQLRGEAAAPVADELVNLDPSALRRRRDDVRSKRIERAALRGGRVRNLQPHAVGGAHGDGAVEGRRREHASLHRMRDDAVHGAFMRGERVDASPRLHVEKIQFPLEPRRADDGPVAGYGAAVQGTLASLEGSVAAAQTSHPRVGGVKNLLARPAPSVPAPHRPVVRTRHHLVRIVRREAAVEDSLRVSSRAPPSLAPRLDVNHRNLARSKGHDDSPGALRAPRDGDGGYRALVHLDGVLRIGVADVPHAEHAVTIARGDERSGHGVDESTRAKTGALLCELRQLRGFLGCARAEFPVQAPQRDDPARGGHQEVILRFGVETEVHHFSVEQPRQRLVLARLHVPQPRRPRLAPDGAQSIIHRVSHQPRDGVPRREQHLLKRVARQVAPENILSHHAEQFRLLVTIPGYLVRAVLGELELLRLLPSETE